MEDMGKSMGNSAPDLVVGDLMESVPEGSVFTEDAPITNLFTSFQENSDRLAFYVTDIKGRLLGQISLEHLASNIFPEVCRRSFLGHGILSHITTDSCRQLINQKAIALKRDDDPAEAVEKMVRHNILEIPVTDSNGKIMGLVKLSALLCHRLSEGF